MTTIEANAFTYCENLIFNTNTIDSKNGKLKLRGYSEQMAFGMERLVIHFGVCKNLAQINVSDANTVYNSDNNTDYKKHLKVLQNNSDRCD